VAIAASVAAMVAAAAAADLNLPPTLALVLALACLACP